MRTGAAICLTPLSRHGSCARRMASVPREKFVFVQEAPRMGNAFLEDSGLMYVRQGFDAGKFNPMLCTMGS